MTFSQYLTEQEDQQQVQNLQDEIKKVSRPENVQKMIRLLNVKDVDGLISKLRANPHVQQVFKLYQTGKTGQLGESILGSLASGALNGLKSLAKLALGSITKTIGYVLGGFLTDEKIGEKINYAGILLLTFGLSGTLLAVGAPTTVALAAAPLTAAPWAVMWFGLNFLEPVIRRTG